MFKLFLIFSLSKSFKQTSFDIILSIDSSNSPVIMANTLYADSLEAASLRCVVYPISGVVGVLVRLVAVPPSTSIKCLCSV